LLARDLSQALNIRGKPVGPCWSSICVCVPTKFKWITNFVRKNSGSLWHIPFGVQEG
jgi:hypothetical protein